MNKENKEILREVERKIAISEFYEEEAKNMKNRRKIVFKVAMVACCVMILITGGVLAKDIENFIRNLFGANTSDGVDTAINNGYVTEIETEIQKAEGIEIKVDSLVMDDFNFAMNFNVTLDERYDKNEFKNMELYDLRILDEEKNVVFSTGFGRKDLKASDKESEYRGAFSFLAEEKGERELKLSLSASGNPELFPKSKHLSLAFTQIRTWQMDEENNNFIDKFYEGDWHFEVDIPEEFYQRETIFYRVKKCNDDKTQFISAILSNTALRVAFITSTDKIDYQKIHEPTSYDTSPLQKAFVETSDGKRFEPSARSDGDGGSSLSPDNIIDYYQTFNLTKYDATDEITLHIFTNKGEEIIWELVRE